MKVKWNKKGATEIYTAPPRKLLVDSQSEKGLSLDGCASTYI